MIMSCQSLDISITSKFMGEYYLIFTRITLVILIQILYIIQLLSVLISQLRVIKKRHEKKCCKTVDK